MNIPNPPLYGPSNFSILIGSTDTDNSDGMGEVFTVSKVFFREFSSKNDIGMLKLSSRITFDGKRKMPVTLPTDMNYYPKNRTKAYVDGWGTNPQNTDNLLRANIYTVSVEECNSGGNEKRDRTYQICTNGDNGAGPCEADSGGPMLRAGDGVQIGIVSWVPVPCSNEGGLQSIFTSVASNLDWIRSTMNGKGGNNQEQKPGNNKPPNNLFGIPFGIFNPNKP